MQPLTRSTKLILIALLIWGAFLRLYDLTDQPIDFHATRQLRGMIVARGIYYSLLPGADPDLRQQAQAFQASTGQYEPPILETLSALAYLLAGQEIFWVARIINTLFWLIGGLALFDLARRMTMPTVETQDFAPPTSNTLPVAALLALAYYLVLPFSVQASRSFQPDPSMVMWIILAAYALYRWSAEADNTISQAETGVLPARIGPTAPVRHPAMRWAVLAGLFAGIAIITKAIAIYTLGVAMAAVVLYTFGEHAANGENSRLKRFGATLLNALRSPQVWAMGILAILPTAAYYLTRQGRAAQYFSTWTISLSHLLLTPRFYLAWVNLVQEVLTPTALIFALAGLWLARRRSKVLLLGLWLGYLVYGFTLPYQMNTHTYYHLQLVPLAALSMSLLFEALARLFVGRLANIHNLQQIRLWEAAFSGLILLVVGLLSWQALVPLYGKDYRNEPAYWKEIASYLPADGKIVALTQDYGYRLMYYGWRKVILWPNRGEIKLSVLRGSPKDFEDYFTKRTEEKRYFLITAFNQFEDQPELQTLLYANYPIAAQGQGYLIFNLALNKDSSPRMAPLRETPLGETQPGEAPLDEAPPDPDRMP